MSTRTRAIMIVAVGIILLAIGIGASFLLINRINANARAAQQQVEVVKSPVVVLAHDMSLGARIADSDVSIEQIPVDVIPRDAVTSLDGAVGKILKSDVVQGEMLLQHDVADPTNNNHDLSFILSPDHVLMAFPASDLMSQQNVIQRGDIIDIFATFPETVTTTSNSASATDASGNPVATPQPESRDFTLDAFQKVSVTALVMGNSTDNQTGSVTAYLLALNPQDALVIKHLKDEGANFDVVLRAPTSTEQFDLTPVTNDYIVELYGLQILP